MMMDPTKLNGIHDWPIPKSIKQVCSFLGFGNFYRCFIWKLSKLTQPMNKLLQKDQPFIWDDTTQQAFDKMKKCFTKEPVLMMPDQTRPFQIECDASKYACGAVLTQLKSMVIDTHVPLYHGPSPQQNGIMKSMIVNFYW